jgi:hypothetical protein
MAIDRVIRRKLGQRVPVIPEYVAAAEVNAKIMKENILQEALKKAPKKWGGKKNNNTLKSRSSK